MATTASRTSSRIIRWVIRLTVILALIMAGVLTFLTQMPGEKLLANLLERQLSLAIRQDVRIGVLETNLFSRLQLTDLHINESSGNDSSNFLALATCRIEYDLSSILWRKLVINSADLSGMKINILRDSAGILNLPQFPATEKRDSPERPPPIQLELRHLNMTQGIISYIDDTGDAPSIKMFNLQAMLNLEQDSIYQCRVQVDTNRILYRNSVIDISDLLLIGTYSGGKVLLDSLQCYPPGMVLLGAGSAVLPPDDPTLNAKVKIRGDPSEFTDILSPLLPQALSPVAGQFTLEIELDGHPDKPTLKAHLASPSLTFSELQLDSLKLEAGYADATCEIRNLSMQSFQGQFGLVGTVTLDSLYSYHVSTSGSGIDLASVWSFIYGGKSLYKGQLEGYLKARGDLRNYKQTALDANVRLSNLRYRNKNIDDFDAVVSIVGGAAQLRFIGEGARAEAALQVVEEEISGQFTVNMNQLNPLAGFLNQSSLKGNLQATGNISGSVDNPEIDARIEAKQIRVQNIPIDSLRSRIRIRGSEVMFDELNFGGGLTITDSTVLPFDTKELTGTVSYTGSLHGRLDNLQGFLELSLFEPGYQNLHFDAGSAQIVIGEQRISLSPFELIRDTLRLQLEVDFDMNTYRGNANLQVLSQRDLAEEGSQTPVNPADILLSSDLQYDVAGLKQFSLQGNLNIRDVAVISSFIPKQLDIGGNLDLQYAVDGIPKNYSGEIQFYLQKPRLGTAQFDSIRGMVTFDKEYFAVPSFELFLGDYWSWLTTRIEFVRRDDGRPVITAESVIQGEAHGDNFPLAVINPLLPDGYSLSGSSSHNLIWGGTISNPYPSGTIQIENGKVIWGAEKPEFHDLFLDFTFQPNAVETNRFDGYLGNIPFNLDATVITPDHRDFDLDVDLKISDIGLLQMKGKVSRENVAVQLKSQQLNLASLQPFFPTLLQLEGILNTEIAMNGSPLDPQIDGHIDIRELILHPAPLLEPFSGGIVSVHFDRNSVYVDSLFLRMGQGWILSQGTLTHDDRILKRIDLTTTLRKVKYAQPEQLDLSVKSADLHYYGETDRYYLDGDIVLGKSKVLVNFQPQALLPFTQSMERPVPSLPDFMTKTQLDIRVRDTEELWIDNNIARLRLHPELEFIGSAAQINLVGRLVIEEGYVLFLDRKFKMNRGVVDFIDPVRINPIVDIQAVATVRNYQAMEVIPYDITLEISGSMDGLIVELTSDPALERADIASLLTLGATREQLTGSSLESDDPSKTDILVDRAGELSSRKVSGYISKNLAGVTGLDDVSIEGNLFRFGKSWGPRLVASKKITDRMEIIYTTNVGHFNEKNVRVDYRLSKYFWIESETDQRGKAGLDLKYKIKLK